MKTFKFTALGMTFTTKATDYSTAMVEANQALPLGAGAWFETTETEFRWIEGNFFD